MQKGLCDKNFDTSISEVGSLFMKGQTTVIFNRQLKFIRNKQFGELV